MTFFISLESCWFFFSKYLHRHSIVSRYQRGCLRKGHLLPGLYKGQFKVNPRSIMVFGINLPVSKKSDVISTQEWKQFLFASSYYRIVMSLIHAWFGIILLLTYVDKLLHLRSSIIGDSEFLEFALLYSVVNRLCCVFKGCLAIR